jgi:hypothetical protein
MRPRCELLAIFVLVGLGGCNRVLGLDATRLIDAGAIDDAHGFSTDRDRDGILDDVDPCIASIADNYADNEGDGSANDVDSCPFGYDESDGDGDGIVNECDPFPALGGDRIRCTMTFQSATINRALWRVHAGEWNLVNTNLNARTPGTLLAEESLEAMATTSYDAIIYTSAPSAPEAALTLWLRADPLAGDGLGCEVRGTTTTATLRIRGTSATSAAIDQGVHRIAKLQATLAPLAPPGTPNVRCAAWFISTPTPLVVTTEAAWPAGRVGITFEAMTGVWNGLQIFERDDVPAL